MFGISDRMTFVEIGFYFYGVLGKYRFCYFAKYPRCFVNRGVKRSFVSNQGLFS
jgi:hypothetical protein